MVALVACLCDSLKASSPVRLYVLFPALAVAFWPMVCRA